MAGGFPVRISRAALGPRYKNRGAVRNAEKDLDADAYNLLLWQSAGAGLVVPLAWILVSAAAVAGVHGEAWDPEGLGTLGPATASGATGVYTVTYPVSSVDKDGAEQPISLVAAKASPQTTSDVRAVASVRVDGITVDVSIFNAAGAPVNAPFLLEVR